MGRFLELFRTIFELLYHTNLVHRVYSGVVERWAVGMEDIVSLRSCLDVGVISSLAASTCRATPLDVAAGLERISYTHELSRGTTGETIQGSLVHSLRNIH